VIGKNDVSEICFKVVCQSLGSSVWVVLYGSCSLNTCIIVQLRVFLWGFCHLRQFPSFTVLFSRKILYSAVVTLDFFCWLFGFDFYVSILFNMFFSEFGPCIDDFQEIGLQ